MKAQILTAALVMAVTPVRAQEAIAGGTVSRPGARARPGVRVRGALLLALLSLGLAAGASASAQAWKPLPEYEVKAAFLLNFTRYVSWPEDAFELPESPIVIGIFGEDPFGAVLDSTIRDKIVNDRPLVVQRFSRPEEAKQCHLVFFSRAEKSRQADVIAALNGEAVLTVGETDPFLRDGGGINLVLKRDKTVKFEVNLEVTSSAGLTVSSQMLRLAQKVIRPRNPDLGM